MTLRVPIAAAGALTADPSMVLTLPSAETKRMSDGVRISTVDVPSVHALMLADGIYRPKLLIDSTLVNVGVTAPFAAPTVAPKAVQAKWTFDISTDNIDDGDTLILAPVAHGDTASATNVTFKTTLSAIPASDEVKIGADDEATIANLEKLIEGTGTDGVDYKTSTDAGSAYNSILIEVESKTATTAIIKAKKYGTVGNGYNIILWSGWVAASLTQTTTGTAGSGTAPEGGSYRYFYTHERDIDSASSGPSPKSAQVITNLAGNIDLSVMTNSADTDFDNVRWYRTLTGSKSAYPGERVASAGTTDTDDLSDVAISVFGRPPFEESLHRTYPAGPPPIVRYLAGYKGRVFGGGAHIAADKTLSTMSVAGPGTSTQVGVSFHLATEAWVGREVSFTGRTEVYTIVEVDEANGQFELDRFYEGSTDATIVGTLKDKRDPLRLYFSEPGLPNSWPTKNEITDIASDDSGGITGLIAHGGALIIFTNTSVYRLTGDDIDNFQLQKVIEGVGCVNGDAIVAAEGGLIWLARDGIYAWSGSGVPEKISSPPTQQGDVKGIDDTIARISHAHAHTATAHYDHEARTATFLVPMDDSPYITHGLVLDLGARGAWSLDDRPAINEMATVVTPGGDQITVMGDLLGVISEEKGNADGGHGSAEAVYAIASSTTTTLTATGASWGATPGASAIVVKEDGTSVLHVVASISGDILTFLEDATAAPSTSANARVVYGGILMDIQTGRFDMGETRREKTVTQVVVSYSPIASGEYHFAFSRDQGDWCLTKANKPGDFVETSGRQRFATNARAVLHRLRLACIQPGIAPAFLGMELLVRLRSDRDY